VSVRWRLARLLVGGAFVRIPDEAKTWVIVHQKGHSLLMEPTRFRMKSRFVPPLPVAHYGDPGSIESFNRSKYITTFVGTVER
jgi:hypothetical protein